MELIDRVGWDGAIRPPDPNELGWKDTVRMNPLEDAIVALRPSVPVNLPFKVPDSIRPFDPNRPLGSTTQFTGIDPTTGTPTTVVNQMYDFGWEYIWHCHLLGHEENDMMRPIVFQVSPTPPVSPAASQVGPPLGVKLTWTNQWTYPAATSTTIQRATNAAFTTGVTTFSTGASATTHTDTAVTAGTTYYYRVRAENAASYSPWSSAVSIVPLAGPAAPTNVTAVASAVFVGPAQIVLTWTESTTVPVTGFIIERATNAAFTTGYARLTVGSTARKTTLTGLLRNTKYWVRITAVSGTAQSPPVTVTATTPR